LDPAKKDIDRQRNQRQRDNRAYKHGTSHTPAFIMKPVSKYVREIIEKS
jgi:hypothetical protein